MPKVLVRIQERLAQNQPTFIGRCKLTKAGVEFEKHGFFTTKQIQLPWARVSAELSQGEIKPIIRGGVEATSRVVQKGTRLECVFTRNTVLPAKTKRTVEVAKSVMKGTTDEIRIIIVEGPAEHHSSTNKPLGVLRITGSQISKDLLRGTEIDLSFAMSESRDLTVSAYLNGTGQEFSQVFDPKARSVPVDMLSTELMQLEDLIQQEQDEAQKNNKPQIVAELDKHLEQTQGLISQAAKLSSDDVTDDRFKLEDKKRQLAQAVFQLTSTKRLDAACKEYREARKSVGELVMQHGNDRERHRLADVVNAEGAFIESSNPERIEAAVSELESLRYGILFRMPEFQVAMFERMVRDQTSMNDPVQARQLIEAGKGHLRQERWSELTEVVGRLLDLLPDRARAVEEARLHTGIM